MATPIAHSLGGYVIYMLCGAQHTPGRFGRLLLCLGMANAPDLDFLPGILLGKPALYHQGITHSLGFAFVIALMVAGLYSRWREPFSTIFLMCGLAYLSHLVIDLFGPDKRLPYGIPLFWPLSGVHLISPIQIFLGVQHAGSTTGSTAEWLDGLLHTYNLRAIAREIVLLLPFVLLSWWGNKLLRGRQLFH